MNTIQFVERSKIDEQKWNALISASVQSLPYAFTWYLDAVAEHWDALIIGDYDMVMPLVWMRKLGVKCMYQPYYCQQLGIFSKTRLKEATANDFIAAATKRFVYININLNSSVSIAEGSIVLLPKKNLLLNLTTNYSSLKRKFSDNHKRNLARAEKANITFTGEVDLKKFQEFYIANVNREKENFKIKHELIFRVLSEKLVKETCGEILGIVDAGGNLLAAVLLIHHQNRIVSIINTSSVEGKQQGASHYLFDRIIHKYALSEKVIDFEGSSIPGIARFYEGFGGYAEIFYNFKYDLLNGAISPYLKSKFKKM